MKMQIGISTVFGMESVLKRELYSLLSVSDAPATNGLVRLEGDIKAIAMCNLWLRTAERVYIVAGEGRAETFDELFDRVSSVPWVRYLPQDARIVVNAKSVDSKLFALSACQSIAKKAIVKALQKGYRTTTIAETGATYDITVSLYKDEVSILIDTSGVGLHKRGYRDKVGEASIKETMAAGLILLSVWNKNKALIDPFCGAGTIPIEAALIGHNIAPGLHRSFAFASWSEENAEVLSACKEDAQSAINQEPLRIAGYDIDPEAIKLCRHHADRAGVGADIHFQCMDMREVASRQAYGVIVTNPPYGERLLNDKEVDVLMRDFARMMRGLPTWSVYLISSYAFVERAMGRRADKNRKLFNAKLECRYFSFLGPKPPKKDAKTTN